MILFIYYLWRGFSMKQLKEIWLDIYRTESEETDWWIRKKDLCKKRNAQIVRIKGIEHIYRKLIYDNEILYHYLLHVAYLIKQNDTFYHEEHILPYQFRVQNGKVIDHKKICRISEKPKGNQTLSSDQLKVDAIQ